jgi:potassium efflux system protein
MKSALRLLPGKQRLITYLPFGAAMVLFAASVWAQGPDGPAPADKTADKTASSPATKPATAPASQPVLATQPAGGLIPTDLKSLENMIDLRMKEVSSDGAMDEKLRQEVLEIYAQAKAQLAAAKATAARTEALDKSAASAPEDAMRLKQATTQPASQPATAPFEKISLSGLEAQLKKMEVDLAEFKSKAGNVDESIKSLARRQESLPADIVKNRDELAALSEKTDAIRASADPEPLKRARQSLNWASRRALDTRGKYLETTLSTADAMRNLLRAQQEYFVRQTSLLQARLAAQQAVVAAKREQESRRLEQEAKEKLIQAAGEHPLVRAIKKYNLYLAQLRTGPEGLDAKRRTVAQQQATVAARLSKVNDAADKARQWVKEVGQTDVVDLFLRNERSQLPDLREHRLQSKLRQEKMARAKLLQFRLTEKAVEIGDPQGRADNLVQAADPPIAAQYKDEVRKALVAALTDTRKALDSLIPDEQSYFNELVKLDTDENRLISQAEKFRSYIDEQVLWTRSASPLAPGDLGQAGRAMAWFASPANWRALFAALAESIRRSPLWAALAALAIAALLMLRRRLTSRVRLLGKRANQYGPGAMARTIQALALAVLSASTWPAMLLVAGWALIHGGEEAPFAFAVGNGLMTVAAGWLPIAVVIGICRKDGLGEAFFRWPTDAMRRKVRSLRWLVAVESPLLFVAASLQFQPVIEYRESLGRIACTALLAALGAYVAWMFWPGGRMVMEALGRRRGGWLYRFRMVWYPLAVLVPLWLAGAAAMGYYYTTLQLSGRLLVQLWVIIALVVFQSLLHRWFTIGAARLARAKHSGPPSGEAPGPGAASAKEAQLPTVSEAAAQVRQFADYVVAALTLIALWLVWADVLPALRVLRDIELWKVGTGPAAISVSLADAAFAVVVLVLTVIASKNIPGILEVAVLRRLQIESGACYAINALARYVIAVVGFILTAQAIGIQWGHVQWLVAGVSVGLGFGLQEIFGNFISGLILLFERPIRVGDVVTVGEVTGTVTQIRIRATTILDWDRKELVVPNKEFITNRLVNWTLSDTVLRVVVPVGIAYGSDTKLARDLLLKVGAEHSNILRAPAPQAFFLGFGESSLNFELRVFVPSFEHFVEVRNDLHMAIDEAFRKANIEIAFPQRDIHIRSIDAPLPGAQGLPVSQAPKGPQSEPKGHRACRGPQSGNASADGATAAGVDPRGSTLST